MRQLTITRYGGPDVLAVIDADRPAAVEDEVLVEIAAAPLQIADVALRQGSLAAVMPEPHTPISVGWEFAGTIVNAGPGVTEFESGDAVIGMSRHFFTRVGTQAEYVAVPVSGIARAPADAGPVEASTIPIGLTARQALDLLDVHAGSSVLITGGAGTVGGYAVQLAAARGATVVTSVDRADYPLVNTLGATYVVDRRGHLNEQVRPLVPRGVDALFDTAGDPTAIQAVRDQGRAVAVLLPEPQSERGIEISVVFVEPNGRQLAELVQMVDRQQLLTRVARTYRLDEAAAAHRRLEQGGLRGRLVFDLTDSEQVA